MTDNTLVEVEAPSADTPACVTVPRLTTAQRQALVELRGRQGHHAPIDASIATLRALERAGLVALLVTQTPRRTEVRAQLTAAGRSIAWLATQPGSVA